MSIGALHTGSFLGNHFQHLAPIPLGSDGWAFPDWFFYLILFILMLVGFIQVFFPRRFRLIIRATFARNYSNQLIREGNLFRERIGFVLLIVSLVSTSIFIFTVIWYFSEVSLHISAIRFFIFILTLVSLYWGFKFLITNIMGDIFRTRANAKEIQLSNFLIYISSGLTLLALLFPILYLAPQPFIIIALAFLLILLVIKIIRGFIIGSSDSGFSVFHLFLYLCTLEILPLLLLVKFGFDFMKNL